MSRAVPEPAAVIVLIVGDRERALGTIGADVPCDLGLVDHLLRLHLAARRRGCSIRLAQVRLDLRQLLELAGVDELFEGSGGARRRR